jgi:hypothetical protein
MGMIANFVYAMKLSHQPGRKCFNPVYYAAALFRLAHRAFIAALIRFRAAAERRRRPLLPLLPGVVRRRAEIAFSRRSRSAVNSSIIDCVFMGVSPNSHRHFISRNVCSHKIEPQ